MESKVYQNKGNQAVLGEITGTNLEILDVGCGAGDNARILRQWGHTIDGITHSKQEEELCRGIMRRTYLIDVTHGLPASMTSQYDYILCSHVLEHLASPDFLLGDLKKMLKQNGRLVVALPNIMHYSSRMKLFWGDFEYQESGIWDNTHLRWYTFKSGKNLLERNGYHVYKSWVDGEIPAMRIFRIVPDSIRKGLFKFLCVLSKGLFGGQLLYSAGLPDSGKGRINILV
jgi:2-polyprenyl-3-methyl-5-hydroxy-6-metoxy-1,4-benzoquinol methylase